MLHTKQGIRRGCNAFSLEKVHVVNEPTMLEQAKENKKRSMVSSSMTRARQMEEK